MVFAWHLCDLIQQLCWELVEPGCICPLDDILILSLQEVLPPPDAAGFRVMVIPLRDVDDEDIMVHFEAVAAFIEEAR